MYGIFNLMCAIRKKNFDKIMLGDVKSQNLKKRKNTKKEINFCTRPPDYCSKEDSYIFLHHDFRPAGQKI